MVEKHVQKSLDALKAQQKPEVFADAIRGGKKFKAPALFDPSLGAKSRAAVKVGIKK